MAWMHPQKRWKIAEPSPRVKDLAGELRTSPLIAQILLNRGVEKAAEGLEFLAPKLSHLAQPGLIPGLTAAGERIVRGIRDKEKIVIYGDYDADGITATAILWHAIRELGGEADFYIPHRVEEGYGLNSDAVEQLCKNGCRLLVTVDCGITAIEQADIARRQRTDLIITDHHEWRTGPDGSPLLPECCSIVHPRLPRDGKPSEYPNPHLCGAGVAFKLAWALGQIYGGGAKVSDSFRNFLLDATGLAALGTIADVVPLVGENRAIAHFGLSGLAKSNLSGIRALIEKSGLSGRKLDSQHVGFQLGPRLNACGRMGHAREAVEMLTIADAARAAEIAVYLDQQNRQRQSMERKIFEQAMKQAVEQGCEKDDCRSVVLGSEGWHIGVVGIVASRIVSRLNRPTVMVALNSTRGQGSARSIPGFHLAHALEACRSHLVTCGGHEMAAGLSLEKDNFPAFRHAFEQYAAKHVKPEMMQPQINLDAEAQLGQVNLSLVNDLERLGPFGQGNRRPVLYCKSVELTSPPRRAGKNGEHLQLFVRQGNARMKCIAFNFGQLYDDLRPGMHLDLAVEPAANEFNGYKSVELEVRDVREAEGVSGQRAAGSGQPERSEI